MACDFPEDPNELMKRKENLRRARVRSACRTPVNSRVTPKIDRPYGGAGELGIAVAQKAIPGSFTVMVASSAEGKFLSGDACLLHEAVTAACVYRSLPLEDLLVAMLEPES
ncbi:hypothetical protein E4U19_006804 [Claviceps sp. Clav32 group G5]|nr:hypothetical protein E4U19_006804 [Claviceps sp. Clav32 group G5]KAG6041604.1 hypothetical protein E4U39_006428 [Claviceps sp. Clav50 group G5]